MLKPICVVAVATERSLPSVVTCPTPPACCASASVHFTPNSRKLFSLMVTICAESSTCPTGRSICDTHCSSVLNAVLLSRSKGDWCVYRRSYSLWHSVASPRFRQLSGVGVLQSNIAIFQRQICLRPRLLRLRRAILSFCRATECTERMLPSGALSIRRFSLQFVVPASGTSVKCNDTVPLTSGETTVQLLLFSQRLQHLSYRNVIHHQRHFCGFAACTPGISINSSAAIHCFICISLPLPQPVWRFAVCPGSQR